MKRQFKEDIEEEELIFSNKFFLNFYNVKIQKKYWKKETNVYFLQYLYFFFITCLNIFNYFWDWNFIYEKSSSLYDTTFSNNNTNFGESLEWSSMKRPTDTINRVKVYQILIKISIIFSAILLIIKTIFFLISFFWVSKHKTKLKKQKDQIKINSNRNNFNNINGERMKDNNPCKKNYDMGNCVNSKDMNYENLNAVNNIVLNDKKTENFQREEDRNNQGESKVCLKKTYKNRIWKKFNSLQFYEYLISNGFILINTTFEFENLKFLISISNITNENVSLSEFISYLHSAVYFFYIFFICSNLLINFISLLFAFLILSLTGTQSNKYYLCFSLTYLILISVFCFFVNLTKKTYFYYNYTNKINIKKTVDIIENLNSGFISFGDHMNLNYNKKFCEIFSILINEIFSTSKKYENTICFLKSLKLEEHLDNSFVNKHTQKFLENHNNINNNETSKFRKTKTKRTSFLNPNFTKQMNPRKKFQQINTNNHNNIKPKFTQINEKEKQSITDTILLLLFFDKESISLDPNLHPEVKDFIRENLLINFEEDELISDIINLDFFNYLNFLQVKKNSSCLNSNILGKLNLNLNSDNNNSSNIMNNSKIFLKNFSKMFLVNKKISTNSINNLINDNNNRKSLQKDNYNSNNLILENKDFSNSDLINNNNSNIDNNNINNMNNFIDLNYPNGKKFSSNIIDRDETFLNNSYNNFINNFSFNNNLALENKFRQHISNKSLNVYKKYEFNNININLSYDNRNISNINIPQETKNQKNSSDNSEYNLNNAFLNYLEHKKHCFSKLINLIKEKYEDPSQFFQFFTFKKKIENQAQGGQINIKVFFRYNSSSDRIELLFNDVSCIIKMASEQAQNKIKKKFLKKFSHEFRNPLLNIIQLVKNTKELVIEKINFNKNNNYHEPHTLKILATNHSNINNLNTNEFMMKESDIFSTLNNNVSNNNNSVNRYFIDNVNSENLDKTQLLNSINFDSFIITKNLLEKENFLNKFYHNSNKSSMKHNIFSMNNVYNNLRKETNLSSNRIYKRNIKTVELPDKKLLYNINKNQGFSEISQKEQIWKFQSDQKLAYDSMKMRKESFNEVIKKKLLNSNYNSSTNLVQTSPQRQDNNNDNLNLIHPVKFDSNEISLKNNKISNNNNNHFNYYYNHINGNNNNNNNLNNNDNLNSCFMKIANLNHIKYICYNLNYLINDFDFITSINLNSSGDKEEGKQEINLWGTYKAESDILTNIEKEHETYKNLIMKVDIHKIAKKIVKIFKSKIFLEEKKVDLNLEIEKTVPIFIKTSLEKITQILFNLISNSIKFTRLGNINVKLNFLNNENKLEFNIFDTGVGIRDDAIKDIFKPFYKSKDNKHNIYGMGLGLYIVKLHVESLKGNIHINSQENKYTNVYFYIKTEVENANNSLIFRNNINENNNFMKNHYHINDNYGKPIINPATIKNINSQFNKEDCCGKNCFNITNNNNNYNKNNITYFENKASPLIGKNFDFKSFESPQITSICSLSYNQAQQPSLERKSSKMSNNFSNELRMNTKTLKDTARTRKVCDIVELENLKYLKEYSLKDINQSLIMEKSNDIVFQNAQKIFHKQNKISKQEGNLIDMRIHNNLYKRSKSFFKDPKGSQSLNTLNMNKMKSLFFENLNSYENVKNKRVALERTKSEISHCYHTIISKENSFKLTDNKYLYLDIKNDKILSQPKISQINPFEDPIRSYRRNKTVNDKNPEGFYNIIVHIESPSKKIKQNNHDEETYGTNVIDFSNDNDYHHNKKHVKRQSREVKNSAFTSTGSFPRHYDSVNSILYNNNTNSIRFHNNKNNSNIYLFENNIFHPIKNSKFKQSEITTNNEILASTKTRNFEKEYSINYSFLKNSNQNIVFKNGFYNTQSDRNSDHRRNSISNNLIKNNFNNNHNYSNFVNSSANDNHSFKNTQISQGLYHKHNRNFDVSNMNNLHSREEKNIENMSLIKNTTMSKVNIINMINKSISQTKERNGRNDENNNGINNLQLGIQVEAIRILIVDDERLIRQSNSNLIKKFFKNKNNIELQIFECEDGFECLNYIYQAKLIGVEFDYLITDQTMTYITGTVLVDIMNILEENKIINKVKKFLLTSYSVGLFNKIDYKFLKVFSKPLKLEHLEFIFLDLENP